MILSDPAVILLHLSAILTGVLLCLVLSMKKKQELHYFLIGLVSCIFIWCAGMLAEAYAAGLFAYKGMIFTNIYFTSVGFVSVFIFLLGRSFSMGSEIKRRYYLLLLLPVLNAAAIWTNDWHHLFFKKYSLVSSELIRGPLANVQAVIAYSLILTGLSFLLYFSIKNAGFFSKQSFLLVLGTIVPLFIDIAFVFNLFSFSMYAEPVSFSFAAACIILAILKYDFLSVVPIALQSIVDQISDSYIVVNDSLEIMDFNRPFAVNFGKDPEIKRKTSILDWISKNSIISEEESEFFLKILKQTILDRKTMRYEKSIMKGESRRNFAVELAPVITQNRYRGTIILIKDITEITNSFELVKQTQSRLIEEEHLVSLGYLAGGIAHNLKTPLSEICTEIDKLNILISKYEKTMGDPNVNREDHREIAEKMRRLSGKIKSSCKYMSEVVSAVKGQADQMTAPAAGPFELSELLKRIDILMDHELNRYGCKLNVSCEIDTSTMVKGDVNSLVQIVDNLIANSIASYEGRAGSIDFSISQDGLTLQLCVSDYGCGIPDDLKEKLFKEMLKTKSRKGTGLGLYISYLTITGKFGGRMWFESAVGKGTSFYISIPVI